MGAEEKLDIVISLRDRFTRGMSGVSKATKSVRMRMDSLKRSVLNVRNAFIGLGLAYIGKSLMQISQEQEKAVAGMETALKSMGLYSEATSRNLQQLATDLQGVTNYGDEATLMGMKFLVTYRDIGMDTMPRTTKAMADLAALMGGDMRQAANMLGKASMGMTGELRKVGITVGANVYKTEGYLGVLRAIESQVTGQAVAQRKATGSAIAMDNAFGDLKETIGKILTMSLEPTFVMMLDWFTKLGVKMNELHEDDTLGKWAEETGEKIRKWFEGTVIGAARLYDNVAPIIQRLGSHFSNLWRWYLSLPTGVQSVGLVVYMLGGPKVKIAMVVLGLLYDKVRDIGRVFTDLRQVLGKDLGIARITKEIEDLESQLKQPISWVKFWSPTNADQIIQKIAVLKGQLKALQEAEGLNSVIDADVIAKETGSAETSVRNFIDSTKTAATEIENTAESIRENVRTVIAEAKWGKIADSLKQFTIISEESFKKFVADAKAAFAQAKAEAEAYAKKIIEIENRILDIRISTADKIRELQRGIMSDGRAFADERKQAEEKVSAARGALLLGDLDKARRFVQEAETLYSGLVREVTQDIGGKNIVVQSLEATTQVAIAGLREVSRVAIEIEETEKKTFEDLQANALDRIKTIQVELDKLAAKQTKEIPILLTEVEAAKSLINDLTKDETKHITIEVEKKTVAAPTGMQSGGIFSGYGGGDRIPVLAEAGEGFIKKEAVRKYGAPFINAINSLTLPVGAVTKALRARIGGIIMPDLSINNGFQTGGIVPAPVAKDMGVVELRIGSKGYPVMGSPNMLTELKLAIERENMLRSN